MKRMLINATQQEELRVALVDGQRLYDLDIESPGHEQKKRTSTKAKSPALNPALKPRLLITAPSVMVSSPSKKSPANTSPANYNAHGRPNIKDVLREGQEVIVQIDKKNAATRRCAHHLISGGQLSGTDAEQPARREFPAVSRATTVPN